MSAITMGTKFPTKLVTELFNMVKGHSSIAKMVGASPIEFTGNTQFTFSFDNDVAVVGEGAQKPAGDATITPVTIRPIKVVYQSRVTEEFLAASEDEKLQVMKGFADGFARKIARGLDIMILHGHNPKTGTASDVIGNNYLDYAIANYNSGSNVITYLGNSSAPDDNIDSALALVDGANGVILGKTIRSAIAALNISGARKYPEFAWGATPDTLGAMRVDANETVEADSSSARAYVGNWNALRWGYAKEMPMEIIPYGNPDGNGDLKQTNQVVIRSEAYVGWGIMDAGSFALIKTNP